MSDTSRLGTLLSSVSLRLATSDQTELPVGHRVQKRSYVCSCSHSRFVHLDGKFQQMITIEASGVSIRFSSSTACCPPPFFYGSFNSTLAPYDICPNAGAHNKADLKEWGIYLEEARKRLQADSQPTEGYRGCLQDAAGVCI